MEQREGRINRFKCLAIRQNVADKYGKADGITFKRDIWTEMFEAAKAEKQNDQSELVPFWCFGKNQSVKIERLVPMYPMSKDEVNYERLIKILSLYNAIANSSDCVLLPAGIRSRKVQWEVPRKSNGWAYGFGRANVWYASEEDSRLQDYLTRLVKQIDEYDGENWIDKYAK